MTEPTGTGSDTAASTDAPRPRRRTMGPALLGAAAAGALLAVAGNRPWVTVDGAPEPAEGAGQQVTTGLDLAVRNPAVTALALVALAALGVVLVVRGRVRRVVAGLAALAAAGAAAAVAAAWVRTGDRVADEVAGGPLEGAGTDPTLWAWTAPVAAVVLLLACVVAVRDVRRWPEMGRRYDAPTAGGRDAGPPPPADPADRSSLDLWRALDQGHDPTDTDRH